MAVLLANNASSKLAASVGVAQTTISVTPGEGSKFPSPTGEDWFPVTLITSTGEMEICRCTGRSGDALTIARGQEGTPAREFSAGDRIELRLTAGTLNQTTNDIWTAINDLGDASHANRGDIVPPGVIWMWSGAIPDIPPGWALCDGQNGTPDLRNRFVVAAGSSYAVGATGGANTVTLTAAQMPSHSHSASSGSAGSHSHSGSTNTAGAHAHTTSAVSMSSGSNAKRVGSGSTNIYTQSISSSSAGNHSHSLSINSNGAHTHSISVGSAGSGQAHENRPPYYALAYIMRLAWS